MTNPNEVEELRNSINKYTPIVNRHHLDSCVEDLIREGYRKSPPPSIEEIRNTISKFEEVFEDRKYKFTMIDSCNFEYLAQSILQLLTKEKI